MKKKYVALFIVLVLVGVAYAATRNLVPRADGEGGLGTAAKRWGSAYINTVFTDLLDVVGAADMDYGSADVTDHTFLSDGTGTGEFVLKAGAIDGTEILDNTVDSDDYAADSIDNEHINWADIDNLGDEGAVTLAATVTVSDDESTDDDQEIVFTTDNATLESDGDFHYSPDTGTVTATEFAGGGANLTAIDAATGDSATAFFDAGTIEHEYGGLEADINAYTGLVAITGGSTAEVDSKSELEGHIADVADFAEADGDIYTGVHDFGGATSVEIPNGTDPDVDAVGEITHDGDGADETADESLRGYDGAAQFLWARKLKTIQCTIIKPNDLANATRDACPIWSNESGMTFTITKIEAWSDTDDTVLNVEEEDADGANNASVDELTIATDGTGMYYTTETTITGATIEANHILLLDFDDTDDPGWVKISICGWFNADVD